jgi:hypothetical protein
MSFTNRSGNRLYLRNESIGIARTRLAASLLCKRAVMECPVILGNQATLR